jgi:hypothetical protein
VNRDEIKTLLTPGDLRTTGRSAELAAAIAAGGVAIDDVLRVAAAGPRPMPACPPKPPRVCWL